jgi:hypothetical protein
MAQHGHYGCRNVFHDGFRRQTRCEKASSASRKEKYNLRAPKKKTPILRKPLKTQVGREIILSWPRIGIHDERKRLHEMRCAFLFSGHHEGLEDLSEELITAL